MENFTKIFVILVFSFLLAKCLIKEEINCGLRDTIDNRHHLIDSLYNQIDSVSRSFIVAIVKGTLLRLLT